MTGPSLGSDVSVRSYGSFDLVVGQTVPVVNKQPRWCLLSGGYEVAFVRTAVDVVDHRAASGID